MKGEILRRQRDFPRAGFGADAAVAFARAGGCEVEEGGEGDGGAVAGAVVGVEGHC